MNLETVPLVSGLRFLEATRDSGYRSTAAAVAELVDNAIQATARHIRILVNEHWEDGQRVITLAVLDDGCGMNPYTLSTALQFGGSRHFNDRSSLGRFGMGLPNSSVSQCRRVDLYSWSKVRACYHAYLDLDELQSRGFCHLLPPQPAKLPPWVIEHVTDSGTLVVWHNCDRLDYRKASTVAKKLHTPLGRRFRYFLWEGLQIFVNGDPVQPIDPLYCHSQSILTGGSEYCPPLKYLVRPVDNEDRSSPIQVRFSLLPVAKWHGWTTSEKRGYDIINGAGVSVVRAGREIAYGWHFMGRKRRQNYDDWWRCEIRFEPELDEWFGVTHSKQGINPSRELTRLLAPDLESIAKALHAEVRTAFAESREPEKRASLRNAERKDWLLPGIRTDAGNRRLQPPHGLQYQLQIRPTAEPTFFKWIMEDNMLSVLINQDHPFFEKAYQPFAQDSDGRLAYYLECLLLAYARSEVACVEEHQQQSHIGRLEAWSHALAALLD